MTIPEDSWYSLHRDDGRAFSRVRAGDAAQAVALGRRRDGIPDREPVHARRLPGAIALWLDARPGEGSRPFASYRSGDSATDPVPIDAEELDDLLGGWAEATCHVGRGDLDLIYRDWCPVRGLAPGTSRYLRIAWAARLTWGPAEGLATPDPE